MDDPENDFSIVDVLGIVITILFFVAFLVMLAMGATDIQPRC